MNAAAAVASATTSWWVAPAVVAGLITAIVTVLTLIVQGRRARVDRQRALIADSFGDIAAYCEYPYIVRRRSGDAADQRRITNDLSEVQRRLNRHRAVLRVEAPRIGRAYDELVAQVRAVAGAAIRDGWAIPPRAVDAGVNVIDVDLGAVKPAEDAFLMVVADHLSFWPWWLRSTGRAIVAAFQRPWPSSSE